MKIIYRYTFILIFLVFSIGAQAFENKDVTIKPFYQGKVVGVKHGGSYTYIEVKEKTHKPFWIAVSSADVKKGDFIRFQKEIVVKNFKSKALNEVFDELLFASNLQYRVEE